MCIYQFEYKLNEVKWTCCIYNLKIDIEIGFLKHLITLS